jgi:hypothetical protein
MEEMGSVFDRDSGRPDLSFHMVLLNLLTNA